MEERKKERKKERNKKKKKVNINVLNDIVKYIYINGHGKKENLF